MAEPNEIITIDQLCPYKRLDTFLHGRFPDISRSALQRLIESGDIRVNGKVVKASHCPKFGEQIEVRWPEPKPASAQPEPIPLLILHEDELLLVLNKPPGIVVHPSAGHYEHTLVNALLHHCSGQLSGIGGVARPGIVHRLDKETSGCIVIAKADAAHLSLADQFKQRHVKKTYHALLCGQLPHATGEIRAGIARHPTHRKRMAVTDGKGRDALTTYKALDRFQTATLVEATIHTGRTHQIRVHFLHLGFPLVGDSTYGRRQNKRLTELTGYAPPRQMLHAYSLAFRHPKSGVLMQFKAPWPDDFKDAIAALKNAPYNSAGPG